MKATVLGALLVAGLAMAVVGASGPGGEVLAQRLTPSGAVAGSELIVVPAPVGEKAQLLTVIDPRGQVMSVYEIELATGKIALKSVRAIRWDLQMTEFNGESPLPREIRALLEQR